LLRFFSFFQGRRGIVENRKENKLIICKKSKNKIKKESKKYKNMFFKKKWFKNRVKNKSMMFKIKK
jgi:hypothetical protein